MYSTCYTSLRMKTQVKPRDRKVLTYRPNPVLTDMIKCLMKPSDDGKYQRFFDRLIQERHDKDFPDVSPDLPSS